MNFLRALFWIVLTVVVVVFSFNNWQPVDINLFGGLVWSTRKPVPMILAFLVGFVPLYIWHRAHRWRAARRIDAVERALVVTPPPVVVEPAEPPIGPGAAI